MKYLTYTWCTVWVSFILLFIIYALKELNMTWHMIALCGGVLAVVLGFVAMWRGC